MSGKIIKITLNIGLSEALSNPKAAESANRDLMAISGQKAVICQAKKSIAAFKLREGDIIGLKVTLRGRKMRDFLKKLVNVVFPRVRDFQGVKKNAVDNTGNLSIGFGDQIAFPEIDAGTVEKLRGLQVVITTNCRNRDDGLVLLKSTGIPFEKF